MPECEIEISTDVFEATWTGHGWDVWIDLPKRGRVFREVLPAMGVDEAIAVLKVMTALFDLINKFRDENEGF